MKYIRICIVKRSNIYYFCEQLNELNKRRLEESTKMKEIMAKEEMAIELANQEREKYEAAAREATYLKECAEREAAERKETEFKAIRAAKEKEKLEDALSGSTPQYRMFTWDEIVSATSSFSEDLRIGMGAYGIVYKCTLHHTTVAVKVLHSTGNCKSKQFQQEVNIVPYCKTKQKVYSTLICCRAFLHII